MGVVVGKFLPTDRNTDRIEASRLDNGKICIADRIAPSTIVWSVGIPGVAEINTAAEGGVHDASGGVIYRYDSDCAAVVVVTAFVFRWCVRAAFACDECTSDCHCRNKSLNHSNPQKVLYTLSLFSKSIQNGK